jgi:hypothetical protein
MAKFFTELCPYITSRTRVGSIVPQTLFCLPTREKFYAVFEDYGSTLRACRIISVLYGDGLTTTYLQVEVAGLGRGYVCAYHSFYRNSEDFLAHKEFFPLSERNGTFYLEDHVDNCVDAVPYEHPAATLYHWRRYGWLNNRDTEVECYIRAKYFVATNTIETEYEYVSYQSWKDRKTYRTKEECLADNKVDVADFDDIEEKSYNVTIEVIKTITTTIKATSKESVVNSARTAFEGKSIKVFINGEVEYEP